MEQLPTDEIRLITAQSADVASCVSSERTLVSIARIGFCSLVIFFNFELVERVILVIAKIGTRLSFWTYFVAFVRAIVASVRATLINKLYFLANYHRHLLSTVVVGIVVFPILLTLRTAVQPEFLLRERTRGISR